jgi:hypothetical protein
LGGRGLTLEAPFPHHRLPSPEQVLHSRGLVEEIKSSLERGRNVQVYAVYTQKRDVTRRLESILAKEGIRVAVLTTQVAPEEREAWYERQLRSGVQVVVGHPRLTQTGP